MYNVCIYILINKFNLDTFPTGITLIPLSHWEEATKGTLESVAVAAGSRGS